MKKVIKAILALILILGFPSALFASERLTVNAKINGKDVLLAFDTGASYALLLLKPTVTKMSLPTIVDKGKSFATFKFEIGRNKYDKIEALVIDSIPFPDIDGLIGWSALRGNRWILQWSSMSLSATSSVPRELKSWHVLKIDDRSPIAALIFKESKNLVYLDTGNPGGISLNEFSWNKELTKNPGLPMTLKAGYMPAAGGIFITKLSWSNHFQLGSLKFYDVLIEKNVYQWPKCEAVIGLEALKHFDIIFDLKEYKIYMKKRPYSPVNLKYNRLGATFPPVSMESDKLVAHVLKNSPGYKAGLRSGDVLLKVDQIDMTKWKVDPTIFKKDFWAAASGTKYKLEIERNGKKQFISVMLENIFNTKGSK